MPAWGWSAHFVPALCSQMLSALLTSVPTFLLASQGSHLENTSAVLVAVRLARSQFGLEWWAGYKFSFQFKSYSGVLTVSFMSFSALVLKDASPNSPLHADGVRVPILSQSVLLESIFNS